MKDKRLGRTVLFWVLGVCLLCNLSAQESPELGFKDGSVMHGELQSVSSDSWNFKSYWMEDALNVFTDHLAYYQKETESERPPRGGAMVYLQNGGQLWAEKLRYSEQGFEWLSEWEEVVKVPTQAVKRIVYYGNSSGILNLTFDGLKVLDRAGLQWQSQELSFPDKFKLEASVKFETGKEEMQIILFHNRADLQFRNQRMILEVSQRGLSSAWFEEEMKNRFRVKKWEKLWEDRSLLMNCILLGNQSENKFWLYINGQLMQEWSTGDLARNTGGSAPILFRFQEGLGAVDLLSVQVLDWDGETLPVTEVTPDGADVLLLSNGRELHGELLQLDDKGAQFLEGGQTKPKRFSSENILGMGFAQDSSLEVEDASDEKKLLVEWGVENVTMTLESLEKGWLCGQLFWGSGNVPFKIPLATVHRLSFDGEGKP